MATSKLFGAREKLLCQALKGVHYESGSQKCRWEDAAHDKQEDSSSSEETNDDDEEDDDEGAVARKKLLKKKPKKWCETTDEKWEHVTLKSPHCNSLPSRTLYTHQFLSIFQISKFSFSGSGFTFLNHPVKIKKPC